MQLKTIKKRIKSAERRMLEAETRAERIEAKSDIDYYRKWYIDKLESIVQMDMFEENE